MGGKVFFKFNISGNEGFHKKVCMYGAGIVMAMDISLSAYNHFAAEGAEAETVPPAKSQTVAPAGQKTAIKPVTPEFRVSSARNPIVHWYEYYFCRGFQSGWGCSQRSMRATTSLDLDPRIAAQTNAGLAKKDTIIRDTYSIGIMDRASGNTELEKLTPR